MPAEEEVALQARRSMRDLVVAEVSRRRAALKVLASRTLPPLMLRELGICHDSPLDSDAYATYTVLHQFGVSVPESLYPGQRPLLLSFNISCPLGGFALAQALFENKICELDPTFEETTPLLSLFQETVTGEQKETMIRWFLERGAAATFRSSYMLPNLLFYLATVYDSSAIYQPTFGSPALREVYSNRLGDLKPGGWYVSEVKERKTTTGIIRLVSRFCNPMERDTCRCACSYAGCLPLHKFRNGIAMRRRRDITSWAVRWAPKRWTRISETTISWTDDCQLSESQKTDFLRDACRLEVFTRLGMGHTCCIFEATSSTFPRRQERDEETCRELDEEDVELREQLELIMEAYDKAAAMYSGAIEEFWAWWWATLQALLPEIPAEERRQMFGDRPPNYHGARGWDLVHVYDESELEIMNRSRGSEERGFLGGIRDFFADIPSLLNKQEERE